MYKVAPSEDCVEAATFKIAFASACNTYALVFPEQSSQTFSNPEGVPLYPSDIIILSFTIKAPTFLREQYEFSDQIIAIRKYLSSNFLCFSSVESK
jgi:hypothetical protein